MLNKSQRIGMEQTDRQTHEPWLSAYKGEHSAEQTHFTITEWNRTERINR